MVCNRERYDDSPEADELRRRMVEPCQTKSERVVDANLHIKEMKDHIDCMKRLQAAEAEVARLQKQRDDLKRSLDDTIDLVSVVSDERDTLKRRIAELEAALRPFAKAAEIFPSDCHHNPGVGIHWGDKHSWVGLHDFMRARAALPPTGSQAAPKEGESCL